MIVSESVWINGTEIAGLTGSHVSRGPTRGCDQTSDGFCGVSDSAQPLDQGFGTAKSRTLLAPWQVDPRHPGF